jgi:hypothetical protein
MWYAHRTREIDRVFLSAFVLGSSTRKPTQQSVSEFNQPGQFLHCREVALVNLLPDENAPVPHVFAKRFG